MENAVRPILALAVCAASLLTLASAVEAADADQLKAQAGSWLAAPQNGSKGCLLTFATTPAAGGYAITGAEACATPVPALSKATAWTLSEDGTLSIVDAAHKTLVNFIQDEGSPWETEDGEPMWLLPALGTIDHVPTIESIAGNWAIQKPEGTQPICALKLTGDKDGDGTTKVSPNGDCAAEFKDMKLTLWALEGFGLVLMSDDGTSISFDMKADGSFDKSLEDGGKPLKLVRQP
ncbi:metalloprotease [Rhizobium sp. rho-13.1]|nr:AprI/Inh family metalloprotease inhibitor [Rhizobium sp. L51/94]TQX91182.1 metalloprotease [Rhizobium sp. rho-13.1]TQY19223.1 metalloprotease [Rhizobium sp. rho-1.1]